MDRVMHVRAGSREARDHDLQGLALPSGSDSIAGWRPAQWAGMLVALPAGSWGARV